MKIRIATTASSRRIMHLMLTAKSFAGLGDSVSVVRAGEMLVIKADPRGVPAVWSERRREWIVSVDFCAVGLRPQTPDGLFVLAEGRTFSAGVPAVSAPLHPDWVGVQSYRFRKISDADAFDIRTRAAGGERAAAIAVEFGVAACTIRRILRSKREILRGEAPVPDLRRQPHDDRRRAAIRAGVKRAGRTGMTERTAWLLEQVRQFRGYGLSLAETAAALGVSQPYLSQAVKKWTIPN
jgi:hypothetical protein